MFIVCSGPDTFRAREKARDLMKAFREKFDSNGYATEVIDGANGLKDVMARVGTVSLFTPKRFVRADGCLAKAPVAEVRNIAAKLATDKDQTIVLSVEEDVPAEKTLEALKPAPLVHYPFATLGGSPFRTWLREQATRRGVSQAIADRVAEYTDGDSWLAIQELAKQTAYDGAPQSLPSKEDASMFVIAEHWMMRSAGWQQIIADADIDGLIPILLSQMRSYFRVRDGETEGLHPFVVRKMRGLRVPDAEQRFARLLRLVYLQRSGILSGSEAYTELFF